MKSRFLLKRLLPFAIIWFVFGALYAAIEYGLLYGLLRYPTTGNTYNPTINPLIILTASLVIGLLQGFSELKWSKIGPRNIPLWIKILIKTIFYLFFFVAFLMAISIATSLILNENYLLKDALDDSSRFAGNFAFIGMLLYFGAVTAVSIFIYEITQFVGNGALYNTLFSKYYKPIQEERIFMFLDMNSSTSIAERLGSKKYFRMLQSYYANMTDAILDSGAEIYQYVGDEIVLTWPRTNGAEENKCIQCFLDIQQALLKRAPYYLKNFGTQPRFKGGCHTGEVATGEIGVLRRSIVYTGDILNTAARVQGLCKDHNTDLLVSEEFHSKLEVAQKSKFIQIGQLSLRGKEEPLELYSLVRANEQ